MQLMAAAYAQVSLLGMPDFVNGFWSQGVGEFSSGQRKLLIVALTAKLNLRHRSRAKSPCIPLCMDRGHSLHMFGDMVDTMEIIGMTYVCGGGHAVGRGVCDVATERVCAVGSS